MSWDEAGAFVWHESDVSPEVLGQELRHNGFGWVAVFLYDGTDYVYAMDFEDGKIKHMTKIWNAGWAMKELGWA
jgi:hypothetical protein